MKRNLTTHGCIRLISSSNGFNKERNLFIYSLRTFKGKGDVDKNVHGMKDFDELCLQMQI